MAQKKQNNLEQLFLAELVNLDSSVDNVELGEFKIKKYTTDEIAELYQLEKDIFEEEYFLVMTKDYPNESQSTKKKGKTFYLPFDWIFEDAKVFYNPLLILNLFKENVDPAVIGKCYFRKYDSQKDHLTTKIINPPINFRKIEYFNENGDYCLRKRFKLLPEDLVNLQKFSKAISSLVSKKRYNKQEKFIKIAISFFQDGILKELDPEKEEMRIIDFMIALEALFLKNESELTKKFSNRVTVLISNNESEKQKFSAYANELYKLRSGFVHGSKTKQEIDSALLRLEHGLPKSGLGPATCLQCTVREILRRSILYFMSLFENGYRKQKILDKLDGAISDKDVEREINFAKKKFIF